MQVSISSYADLISFAYIPRRGIVGSYGGFSFSFLMTLCDVFHNDCANLYLISVLEHFFSATWPLFVSFYFWIAAILIGILRHIFV